MSIGVRELRDNLRRELERVKAGETVTITERGVVIAKIVPAESESVFDRLVREGVVTPAKNKGPRHVPHPIKLKSGLGLSDLIERR